MEQLLEIVKTIHLLNAWILSIPIWLLGIVISSTNRRGMKRGTDMTWYGKREKLTSFLSLFSMISFMVCSLFISLKTTLITLPIGILLVLIGAIGHFSSKISYGNADMDKPAVSGLYGISRNPMYAFLSIVFLGVVLLSESLLLFSIWIVIAISSHFLIIGEEKYCMNKYGKSYSEYMNKVPRYFGFKKNN